uniref:glucuronosyltransferase n=1 Tax=Meloidogyne enterolobii TaxID=390850 RepID=A0A6V7V9A7_MELEN|nr:unnamed protein product [Meloidogyne enterolobii]
MTVDDINSMRLAFHKQKNYYFKVIIEEGYSPVKQGNIEITNKSFQVNQQDITQQELLFHPNTKFFISHCDQDSLTEAIYAGVPLICIPNSGDQFYNSSLVEHLGIGKYVLLTFKDEKGNDQRNENFKADFRKALNELIQKYVSNVGNNF